MHEPCGAPALWTPQDSAPLRTVRPLCIPGHYVDGVKCSIVYAACPNECFGQCPQNDTADESFWTSTAATAGPAKCIQYPFVIQPRLKAPCA